MAFTIYNTLTKKKEKFIPVESGKVKFYVCGPTVYDYFHIGNARPFILYDIFRRFLEYRGFQVTYVVNITDVDDKIIRRANEENRSPLDVAKEFIKAFLEDTEQLRIQRPDVLPRATEHIQDMMDIIQKLIDKGIAYTLNGDVYYNVKKFAQYGKLSGKNIDELEAGSRIEIDKRKTNPLDFALWKSAKPGEPAWDSPWGKGRPGWHIECSAMSMKYLGKTFDIHAGGEDLIFPHHENEIAQSCGAEDSDFARYWMHNGFLNIHGEKMSKSLGNFSTARATLQRYPAETIRLFFLQKHYRSPVNFSEDIMNETEQAQQRLQNLYDELKNITIENEKLESGQLNPDANQFYQTILGLKEKFIRAMENDFNSAQAMGFLFDMVKESNRVISKNELSLDDQRVLKYVQSIFDEFDDILGIISRKEIAAEQSKDFENMMTLLLDIRNELRKNKEWELADRIRDELKNMGYTIEDKAEKTVWKKT